ncbi:MAG: hypothetical protein AAF802_29000 [Planctomycetota bacterium]
MCPKQRQQRLVIYILDRVGVQCGHIHRCGVVAADGILPNIKSFEAKQAALESAVMAAEKEHEIAQQVSKKGLMSTQELLALRAKLETEKAKLQEVIGARRSKEVELDNILREVDLTRERAMVAVELAKTEMDAVQKRIVEMRAKQVQKNKSVDLLAGTGLTKEELAGCKMHVAGVYQPSGSRQNDNIYVDVTVDEPSVIVVSSYMEAFWRMRLRNPGAIKLIIVTGYFAQKASFQSAGQRVDDIPILNLTYFNKDQSPNRNGKYAYAYAWQTAEGRELAQLLYEVTGLTASTFQGSDGQGRGQVVLDGKKGTLSNRESKEPIAGLLTEAELAAEPVEFPDFESSADNGTSEQANKANAIESRQEMINKQLEEVRQKLKLTVERSKVVAAELGENWDEDLKGNLETVVEEVFQLEQIERALRVELAKVKLAAVDQRRVAREANAKAIKARMMKELLGK